MDSIITVHVVEPGSSIAPNTGLFMGGSNTSTLLSVILVLIILAQIPIFIYAKKHDKRIRLSRIFEVKTSIFPVFISLLTLTALIATNINATDINRNDSLITVDNTDLTIELGNEPVFAYMPVTIRFKEATPAGYSLTAHADSTELVSITDSTNKISMIALDEDEFSTLSDNTFGLSLSEPKSQNEEKYTTLSTSADNPTIIKSSEEYKPTEKNDETIIYYAFYITPDIPYGTYSGSDIHYDAELNTTTVILNGNGADSGEMGEYVIPAGKSFTLPQNTYAKTGHAFTGWNTEPNGSGTTYSDQADFTAPSTPNSTTLYAQWALATTISFDSNDSDGGEAMNPIAIIAGNTEKLPANTYTKEGHVLLEWNTERDGTGDFYADEAEFTADASESASITLYARWMKDGPYMQDVATWGNALNMGEEMTTIDKRDGKSYIVARLADNNIWMTQNLDLDLRTDRTLTPENTDVPENWAPANSTVRFTGYSIDNWVDNYDTPISADPGELYLYTSDSAQEDYKYTSLEDCAAAHPDCSMHNHIGNYYNWSAAVANNDTSGMTTLYDNAPDSICPAGWRLPTAIGNSHETSDLLVAEGIITGTYSTTYTTDGFTKIRRSPMWLIRPGFIRTGVLVNSLYHGGYWSSTINNGYWAYSLYVSLANHAYPASYDPTRIGLAVRCMAQ